MSTSLQEQTSAGPSLEIEIVSDTVCPWFVIYYFYVLSCLSLLKCYSVALQVLCRFSQNGKSAEKHECNLQWCDRGVLSGFR
jgi:predicted DsbA family dithiol-disulfide isomerase